MPFSTSVEVYITALLVGLLGGVHCLAMCGGLAGSITMGLSAEIRSRPSRMLPYQLAYNLGRILGYGVAGALFGGLGALLVQLDALQIGQRILYGFAGVMMVLLGLYLGGWWRLLEATERWGRALWRRLEPLARPLLPVRTIPRALAVGLIWAWIPCGLVYSVLVTAIATGSPIQGAGVMLAFGLGTLPNLMGIALLAGAAARIAERAWVRQVAGILVLSFGISMLWRLIPWMAWPFDL
ncbi:sulfite exporter TauE/SafE family protein [Imhoffiella purpurea]|uniref:sulfite exporter TauE/SafE family protein n=1 Tax=Imhoffiella purpurea TaxID=1249627 RepID=UPI0005C1E7B1|nr:sulfite exporter TauE/SafE family protein [Imhoffiella purpurea]